MRPWFSLPLLASCFQLTAQTAPLPDSLAPLQPTQVSVGYAKQDARSYTGAVTHLDARQFNQGQIYDWNQLWQGLVPGFTVARAGSDPNQPMDARIRGLRTLNFGTQPLYVVDGVPGVDLLAVDPADIVAVDVLRGAAATAIYGGRGATGVVLITTKPETAGKLKVTYQGQVSYESAAKRYTVLDEANFVRLGGTDYSPNAEVNTDWQSEVLQSGLGHAHHLALSSGLGRGFVRAGLHYRRVEGILRKSGFQQYNASLLTGQSFWRDRMSVTVGATLGQRDASYGWPEAYRYAVVSNPSAPVRSDDPEFVPFGGYFQKYLFDYFNPVAIQELNRNEGRTDYHLLHARAEWTLLRNLTASALVSTQNRAVQDRDFYSRLSRFRGAGSGGGLNGTGQVYSATARQDVLETTLQYRLRHGQWQMQLLGGYGWYHHIDKSESISSFQVPDDAWAGKSWAAYRDLLLTLPEVSYGQARDHARYDRQLTAFFGRAQLQWRDTYFGSFSWRREGSSSLGPNNRWGTFPAFSLGVDVAQLMPMPFDYLKLRLGHGVTGTEANQAGLYQYTFVKSFNYNTYYNGQYIPIYGTAQKPNYDLGWERTTENSWGVDFSWLSGRLKGSVDGYWYRSRDLISRIAIPVPPNFANTQYQNGVEIAGRGTELTLHYQVVNNQNLTWEVGLTAATAHTTLERLLPASQDSFSYTSPGSPCGCGVSYQLLYPGAAIGTFWGPVATGIDANGLQTYQDIDKNQLLRIDTYGEDQTYLGDAQPKWELGLRQQVRWGRFDVNVLLRAVTGHEIIHDYRNFYEANDPIFKTWNSVVTKYYDENLKTTRFNSRIVENGSFLRLQYLALGYRLPLPAGGWVRSLHFQLGAQNLYTWTKYTGLDPELRLADRGSSDNGGRGYASDQVLSPGIDRRGTYPTARLWWLGVQAEF